MIQAETLCLSEQPISCSLPPDQPMEVVSVLQQVRLHPIRKRPES